ncbi:MAG TPA: hypothetical protein VGF82_27055 [Terracidiphilus sp.]|jgi:hypothetical protein
MTKAQKDGLYLLSLGAAVFLLLGAALQHSASDSREDFKAVVYGARCLLHHCDPYSEPDLYRFYLHEFGEPVASHLRVHSLTLYVNLPATILFVAPFALIPFGLASVLWSLLTATSLILAALLAWDLASEYSPALPGALIAVVLSSAAIVLGNLNPAGVVVAFCVIAIWCFQKQRFVFAGVLLLAFSLALKPHDAGPIWLYLLLAPSSLSGSLRKRALQTLAATTIISLAAIVWVSAVAPHWPAELRANMAVMSSPGGNNDPAPSGPTSRDRATEAIVSLQAAISVFRDDPPFYNATTYLACGALLLLWIVVTLRSTHPTPSLTWLALAAIVPVTMLVTYHRDYDTRLLLLAVPACAMLYSQRGLAGKSALLVTTLAIICTGELSNVLLKSLTPNLPLVGPSATVIQKLTVLVLGRNGSITLLLMSVFYLYIYLREVFQREKPSMPGPVSP